MAILGGSTHCIDTHASDLAVAIVALDASVELRVADGAQRLPRLRELHRLPGDTPHNETNLAQGEMITAVNVPAAEAARRSHHLRLRDRASFKFALVSAAVTLHADSGRIDAVRLAAPGGISPWPASASHSIARTDRPSQHDHMHVMRPLVDGGFDCKAKTWKPATLAAMAATVVGRLVSLVPTRAQMFTSNGYRPRTIQKLKSATDAAGRLVSMRQMASVRCRSLDRASSASRPDWQPRCFTHAPMSR